MDEPSAAGSSVCAVRPETRDGQSPRTAFFSLPSEILLQIISYLETKEIAQLQLVCKTLLRIGRDNNVWKDLCFQTSTLYRRNFLNMPVTQNNGLPVPPNVRYNFAPSHAPNPRVTNALQAALEMQDLPPSFQPTPIQSTTPVEFWPLQNHAPQTLAPQTLVPQTLAPQNHAPPNGVPPDGAQPNQATNIFTALAALSLGQPASPAPSQTLGQDPGQDEVPGLTDDDEDEPPAPVRSRRSERTRLFANWDPLYPTERVSWYDEYIHRTAPTVVSWFEEAQREDSHGNMHRIEARGMALYCPDGPRGSTCGAETLLAISPLDDGSICIWDVNGTRRKKGSVLAKSKPGILFIDGPSADNKRASKRVDSGVTECVSVDNQRHRAFFAVQSHLIDVDLQNLSVVGCESFPWSITALSPAHATVPLSIATSFGIHLYDYKEGRTAPADHTERVDGFSTIGAQHYYEQNLRALFSDVPLPPYAALAQPGPLSIVHLPRPGSEADLSDDIFVAGRFSHILHYDRRTFPKIKRSIASGGSLCSMASSPYPFDADAYEARRRGGLTMEQVAGSKTLHGGGRTLIACGEYNQKGSLELYGLSAPTETEDAAAAATTTTSVFRNRSAAAGAKLLSVVRHGTRIAVSDAQGYVKWFERDGFTEVRRCKIGHNEGQQQQHVPAMFASMPAADDMARKILPTREDGAGGGARVNDNDLLFWTGEKLGAIGFGPEAAAARDGSHSRFDAGAERTALDVLEEHEGEEDRYRELMRRGLYQNALSGAWFFRGRGAPLMGDDD